MYMLDIGARIIPFVGFHFDWIIQLGWVEMIKHAQGEEIVSKALKGN